MHVWTWCLGSIRPTAAGAPAVAERQHLQVGDGRVVDDGDIQVQAADQLHRPQAGHVFVASQPSLQKLLVGQQEDGSVPTRDVGRHLEHLDLRLRTAGGIYVGLWLWRSFLSVLLLSITVTQY